MGYGEYFIKWTRIFYDGVNSRVLINGEMGGLIQIGRANRQGDSPTSHIYVIVAEVLACRIRQNPNIEGIQVAGMEKKVGGYADDTQCFVSSVGSVGHLFSEVRLYQRASGSRLRVQAD